MRIKKTIKKWFEKNPTGKPVTYFAHIPKTGGTSFTALLDSFFSVNEIFPEKLWSKVKDIDATQTVSYKLIRGHFGGGGVKILTKQPCQYFTMLRKPESLTHSTYQFVKRKVNIMFHKLVIDHNMSFLDFLKHPDTKKLSTNRMTRYLSFDFIEDSSTQSVFLNDETIRYLAKIIDSKGTKEVGIKDDQRLIRAQNFVNQCAWFGLLERFDDSLRLLCYQMKWPPIGQTQHLNAYKKGHQITAQTSTLLNKINQHDLLLYNFAEVLFNQRYQTMLSDLEQYRASKLDNEDVLLDRYYQANCTIQPLTNITYRFDQALRGTGWHRRQLTKQKADYYRWTGPNCISTIDFWLDSQDYQLQLHINNAINNSVLDHLKLTINGKPIVWTTESSSVNRILYSNVTSDLIKKNGLARLGIVVNQVMSHKQAYGSKDERIVGIAVHWIKFMA